jgi:uncharacterized protein Yka (UPF0111/DUF47 family)
MSSINFFDFQEFIDELKDEWENIFGLLAGSLTPQMREHYEQRFIKITKLANALESIEHKITTNGDSRISAFMHEEIQRLTERSNESFALLRASVNTLGESVQNLEKERSKKCNCKCDKE